MAFVLQSGGLYQSNAMYLAFQTEPYTMLKEKSETLQGNDRYEGYNIDMMMEISKILGFNYTIRIVEDGAYGSRDNETDTWNGMIGELLSQVCF